MIFTCNSCQFTSARCIRNKSDAPEAVESFIKEIRQRCGVNILTGKDPNNPEISMIFAGLRRDNEPVM